MQNRKSYFSFQSNRLNIKQRNKIFYSFILLIFSLMGSVYAQNYFDLDTKDSLFRIENQRFGESVSIPANGYNNGEPMLYQCAGSIPYSAARFELQKTTDGYYILYHPSTNQYLSSPDNNEGSKLTLSPNSTGYDKQWKIELVDPKGYYSIKSRSSGFYLSSFYDFNSAWNPTLTRLKEGKILQKTFQANNKDFLWAIDPQRPDVINCIGISQIGWSPKAHKLAIYNSTSQLNYNPDFTVKKGGATVLSGKAVEFINQDGTKSKYYLSYYIMNLSSLTAEGEYELSVNGETTKFVINNDAYWKIRHRYGNDTTRFNQFFDPEFGFMTNWGRMSNWYYDYRTIEYTTPGNKVTWNYPNWQKINVVDGYPDHNTYTDLNRHLDNFAMGKGWNHTDQQWCFFYPTALNLRLLADVWRYNKDPQAVEGIKNEIIYGVDSVLGLQHTDGSFPQTTYGDNAYTGTVAALGNALAAAYDSLMQFDPAKAALAKQGAEKAWSWVENHNSVGDWVPYGTQFYRYGFAQERMALNVELYRITGDSKYKNIADNMILNSKYDNMGCWVSTSGTRFPGEEFYPSNSSTWGLFRYYDVATQNVKDKIAGLIDAFCKKWGADISVLGPYNEGSIRTFGDSYNYAYNAVVFFKTYEMFGDKYAQVYDLAQKRTDWLFGYNHFATSFAFGCGDIFASQGYGSGYYFGRLVPGIIIEDANADPYKITASNHSYNIGESGAGSQLLLMLTLELRERLKNSEPKCVTMYPNTGYAGNAIKFPLGKWKGSLIRSEGMELSDIESMKIPSGYSVIAYEDDSLSVSPTTYNADTNDLGGKNNKIKSFEIIDNNTNSNPVITSVSPADGSEHASNSGIAFSVQASDPEDGNIQDGNISWYSNLAGFIGNGASLNAVLADGAHKITVTVKDSQQAAATKSIIIYVGGKTFAPEANKDGFVTAFNKPLTVSAPGVLENDVDVNGLPLTAFKKSDPQHGTLNLNSDGSFTYSPASGFSGIDSFTYAANNGSKESDPVIVSVRVLNSSDSVPVSISDCVLWLDGSDVNASGVQPDVNQVVTTWRDKSGNNNNAVGTALLGNHTINGLPVLTMDGFNDNFIFNKFTNIRTVFWVVKEDSIQDHFLLGDDQEYQFHRGAGSIWAAYAGDMVKGGQTRLDRQVVDGLQTNLTAGQPALISLVTSGNATASRFSRDRDEYSRTWSGDVAEIIIYTRDLSSSEVSSVEDYLYNKWFAAPSKHSLTVNSGTGSGSYNVNENVNIQANSAPAGQVFDAWTGDVSYVADTSSESTVVVMPDKNITVTATYKSPGNTYSISGNVSGDVSAGVTISAGGKSAVTDGSGNYTISGLADGSYTVTPTLAGYTFAPANQSTTISGGNVTGINFTATSTGGTTYSVSGTVTGDVSAGVTVSVDTSHSAVTDGSGNYTISGLADGSYTVTPSLAGYTFAPATASATVSGADVTGIDFTATSTGGTTYSVSGTVSGDVSAGVTVRIDAGHTAVTDGSGNYTISGLPDGTYTVTPSLSGYTFAPASQSATVSGADVTGINFTSTTSGGGGGITDPTDIAGCNLWLDGADPKADGSAVTGALDAWKNKADTSNFAYQVDGTKQPEVVANGLNGHSLLRFVGGDQSYPIVDSSLGGTSISNINTIFWVIKESATLAADTCPFFLGNSGTSVFHRGIGDVNAGYAFDGKYWDNDWASDEVKNGQTYLDGVAVDGTNDVFPSGGYHIVSLVLTGPVEVDSISQDRNGAYGLRSWLGDIAEIITYDSALSDTDRQSVEAYLNAKWFVNAPST